MAEVRVATSTKLYYGFGSVAYGVKDNGFAFFLLIYYHQVLGLPETWVGLGILLALLLDAVSDPLVGHLSDHLHSRWGRRHPFMYAAAVPVAVSYYLLWNPPAGLSDQTLFAYFVATAVLVRTCITLYEIPSTSLVAELTEDYDERTSMMSFRYFFGWWGGLVIALIAYAVLLQPTDAQPVGVLNEGGYRTYGLVGCALMFVGIMVSAAGTHRHIPNLKAPPPTRGLSVRQSLAEVRETLSNPSFVPLFFSAVFGAAAAGVTSALNVFLATYFWEFTSSQISILVFLTFGSAAAALALAPRVSARWGKKTAAIAIGLTGTMLSPMPITLRLLGVLPENHSPALLPMIACFNFAEVTLIITTSILVSSMVADVVEDSERTTGRRSEGIFFAARSFIGKVVTGIGIFASTLILSAAGFPDDATPGEVPASTLVRLGLIYAPVVGLLYAASVLVLRGYRITRDSHAANLRELEAGT